MTSANLLRPLNMIPDANDMTGDECGYYASRNCLVCKGEGFLPHGGDVCWACAGAAWVAIHNGMEPEAAQ